MDKIRLLTEQQEEQTLSSYAVLSSNSKGRLIEEPPCDIRTCFARDRDRIIHCKSFRRLKRKTQVFLSPQGDHYRTRLTHTLEVSQIARTIARALRLNEDLTEAIALGHDLGHTPFGHAGERALNECAENGFHHYLQSARVVEYIEKDGNGLNLSDEVINGIRQHTTGDLPYTLEGQVVRISDKIAYMNHDIDDAVRAKVFFESDVPKEVAETFGKTKSSRINSMVMCVINNSFNSDVIKMDEFSNIAFLDLHTFLFKTIYKNESKLNEEKKADELIKSLFNHYINHHDTLPEEYCKIAKNESANRAVTDYIACMTDDYAVRDFSRLFVPQAWGIIDAH